MLKVGGNIYYTIKIAFCDGLTFQDVAGMMSGVPKETLREDECWPAGGRKSRRRTGTGVNGARPRRTNSGRKNRLQALLCFACSGNRSCDGTRGADCQRVLGAAIQGL